MDENKVTHIIMTDPEIAHFNNGGFMVEQFKVLSIELFSGVVTMYTDKALIRFFGKEDKLVILNRVNLKKTTYAKGMMTGTESVEDALLTLPDILETTNVMINEENVPDIKEILKKIDSILY